MPRIYWSSVTARSSGSDVEDKALWLAELRETSGPKELIRRWKFLDVGGSLHSSPSELLAADLLVGVHAEEYVNAIVTGEPRAVSESSGRPWTPGLCGEALSGVIALRHATLEVALGRDDGTSGRIVGCLTGEMHHARREAGAYGSVFNGVVSAARLALDHDVPMPRVGRVLLLDLDGDCAGGVASLIEGDQRIYLVDVAIGERDAYRPSANAYLDVVGNAADYLDAVRRALGRIPVDLYSGHLCLYSAGVDGHEAAERGLPGLTAAILAERDRLVFSWCLKHRIRTAFLLGGGETSGALPRESLVALHRQTIDIAGQLVTAK